jgi:hypothetical protein
LTPRTISELCSLFVLNGEQRSWFALSWRKLLH